MGFLTKEGDYTIVKLYKEIDSSFILKKKMNSLIIELLKLLELENCVFDGSILNYNNFKFNNLENLYKKLSVVSLIDSYYSISDTNKNYFLADITDNGTSDFELLTIEIGKKKNKNHNEQWGVLLNVLKILNPRYGYMTYLPSNFDFLSEKKIKWYTFTTKVDKSSWVWHNHYQIMDNGGFKFLYEFNIINNSHLNTEALIYCNNNSIGTFKQLTLDLYLWKLSKDDFHLALKILRSHKLFPPLARACSS